MKKRNWKKKIKKSYRAYMTSERWEKRKRYWLEGSGKRWLACFICNRSDRVDLHHLSYKRLGREKHRHLMPLCFDHHIEVHWRLKQQGLGISETIDVVRQITGWPEEILDNKLLEIWPLKAPRIKKRKRREPGKEENYNEADRKRIEEQLRTPRF